jgi:dephospho-CoA kinase
VPAPAGHAFSVAVTGGIGSGKSEVARAFAARGAVLIDADQLAREVVAVGEPALAAIVEAFGPGVLTVDGDLDRAALARESFGRPAQLETLNAIVHPRVAAATRARIDQASAESVVVYDVPLLDGKSATQWDLVVVVIADRAVRLARLVELRGMTESDAVSRMDSQPDDEAYLELADLVILNHGERAQLAAEIDRVWKVITDEAAARMS